MMKKTGPVAALVGTLALARMRPTPNKATRVPKPAKKTPTPKKARIVSKRFPWHAIPLALGAAALGRFFSAAARAARAAAKPPVPPKVKRQTRKVRFGEVYGENRGDDPMDPAIERDDDLFWLRDDARENPEVLKYLAAENLYTEEHLKHVQPLTETLYEEIIRSIKESDTDLSFRWGDWDYFVDTVKDTAYPVVKRRRVIGLGYETSTEYPLHTQKTPEIVLDVNEVAKPMAFCSIGGFKPSPKHTLLAYAVDDNGDETYEIRFKDLTTGFYLKDLLLGCAGEVSWGCFNAESANAETEEEEGYREVFYSTHDESHRCDKVWRHVIGTTQDKDTLVLFEPDPKFSVYHRRSHDGQYMLISAESTTTNEVSFVGIDDTIRGTVRGTVAYDEHPVVFQHKRNGHRYYPEHRGGRWFILSNRLGKINFDLYRTRTNRDDAIKMMMGKKIERGIGKGEATWQLVLGSVQPRGEQSVDNSSVDNSSLDVSSADESDMAPSLETQSFKPAPKPFASQTKKEKKSKLKPGATEGFPYSKERTLESLRAFENFLVLEGREDGFSRVWVLELDEDGGVVTHHRTEWPIDNGCVYTSSASESLPMVSANQVFKTDAVFITFTSLNCPKTVYQYDMTHKTKEIKRVTPALEFDKSKYATTRMECTVRDGMVVPISLAWKPGAFVESSDMNRISTATAPPKNAPMLLTGYGSYGVSNDPVFSRDLVPLMDRGVTVCIAHVRGGGDGPGVVRDAGEVPYKEKHVSRLRGRCGGFGFREGIHISGKTRYFREKRWRLAHRCIHQPFA